MSSKYPASAASAIERSGRYVPDRRVVIGAVVTAAATHLLVLVPALVEFRTFRADLFELTGFWFWDDPFPAVRFLGGIVGGYAAGYLTRDSLFASYVNGVKAVLLGVGLYYVTSVAGNALRFLAVGELTGSILLVFVLQPLLFLVVPMALLYTFESLFSSPIGTLSAGAISARLPAGSSPDEPVAVTPPLLRALAGALVCLGLFAAVWGFVFYLTNVLFAYQP